MKTNLQRGKALAGFRQLVSVLKFSDEELIPTIIQDAKSKQVLTLCYLNREALRKSLQTGTVYLFRRSQQTLMRKGETSGHIQFIQSIAVDCEGKSLVFFVRQRVAACHAGYFSCYFRILSHLGRLQVQSRKVFDPKKVYKGVSK